MREHFSGKLVFQILRSSASYEFVTLVESAKIVDRLLKPLNVPGQVAYRPLALISIHASLSLRSVSENLSPSKHIVYFYFTQIMSCVNECTQNIKGSFGSWIKLVHAVSTNKWNSF